jgi:WD40 repeat protein
MEGHEDVVQSVSLDSACKTAVSGSGVNALKLWDLGSGQCIESYEHGQEVYDVMMHESGSSFLSVGGGVVKAWATASGPDRPLLDANLSALCDPDEAFVGAASRDLSRVGVCFRNYDNGVKIGLSVWR